MLYGANMLSLVPGEWSVVNGTVSSTSIMLGINGLATQELNISDLATIPAQLLISLACSRYTDPYAPDLFAMVHVETAAGETYDYTSPIINTAANMCTIAIPMIETEYTVLAFSLRSLSAVTISEWGLFAPLTQSVDMTEIQGMIPRLLKDYNRSVFAVNTAEDIIAQISSYVTEATEMSGHLSLSYVATEASSLIIRIRDNSTEELYCPAKFIIPIGAGTIGLPHAYLAKEAGYHDFTVTAQVTSGTISIDTRKILYVIDGAHFAYSRLDVGSIVVDLAVKKTASDSSISFIYAVCIDDGICLIKACAYSNILANSWISLATLGPATGAAIAFGGHWNILSNPYTFNTDENPWVAWITPEGVLNLINLTEGSTLIVLATGVLQVCTTVGWNNEYEPGIDQGLIFAYIKTNGSAYYRAYCLQTDYSYAWEAERQIVEFTGVAININAFRTIDFRVGFNILADSGITYTYITTRNWPGMSIPIEHIDTDIVMSLGVTEINYKDGYSEENIHSIVSATVTTLWGLTPLMVAAANIDNGAGNFGLHVLLTWDENVFGAISNAGRFGLSDGFGGAWVGQNVSQNGKVLDITFIDFNNATNPITLAYTPGTMVGDVVAVVADSIEFNAIGLIPTFIPAPEVLGIENMNAQKIILSFDMAVESINWINAKNGFTVSAQEYDMIPDGTLQSANYVIDSVTNQDAAVTDIDAVIADGTLTDTVLLSGTITLAEDI
jgi:hypothetical protein